MHKTISSTPLDNKTVLLRVDLNVPVNNGAITDTTRIDRLKPTIDALRTRGCKIVLLSHFGRPEGKFAEQYSLAFLPPVLKNIWGADIVFGGNAATEDAAAICAALKPGEICLLENLRFHAGEESGDPAFAAKLARLGDIYINDAFSASHRAHASITGLPALLPALSGLLMEEELTALEAALTSPQKPLAAIVGGSKISTKLALLNSLIEKADMLILGGGMANTMLYAQGAALGASLCEKDMKDEATEILRRADSAGCEIVLPVDAVCVRELKPGAQGNVMPADNVEDGAMAVDIGPQSVAMLKDKLTTCKTLIWNGPLGVFEIPPFDAGTNALATFAASRTVESGLITVAGGGDTVAALEHAGAAKNFSYISTAGGAFLEWLEGKTLPGLAALED